MLSGLVHAHSGLRYIVLLLLLLAVINALLNVKSDNYLKKDKMINLFAMIGLHIQLLLGLILYFISEKVNFEIASSSDRFFTIEHAIMMILAITMITLGRRKAESQELNQTKHRMILRYYLLGLIVIFIAIPWPFIYKNLGLGYF